MNGAWIGVIGALGGVAVSGIIAALRSRAESRREKAWALYGEHRKHLEQLYEALEQVREAYGPAYLSARVVATGQYADRTPMERQIPWGRLRMLVHLYVPELKKWSDKVEEAGHELSSSIFKAATRGSAIGGHEIVGELDDNMDLLRDMIDAMVTQIVAESNALREETTRRADKWLEPPRPRHPSEYIP